MESGRGRGRGPSKQPKNNGKSISQGNKGKGKPNGQEPVYMPGANVVRIMRRVLPEHAKITDDAKEMVQKCVSEFIGFITTEANEHCNSNARKTVTAEDILHALDTFGYDEYVPPLVTYINNMRNEEGSRRGSFVPRLVGSTSAPGGHNPGNLEIGSDDDGSVLNEDSSTIDAGDDQIKGSSNNGK